MFLFGKKKAKRTNKKKHHKPPAALIKRARKYRVKISKKVGKKRVYKSVTVIKRLIKRKMRLLKKKKHSKKHSKRRQSKRSYYRRRSRFGESGNAIYDAAAYDRVTTGYGYNQPVVQLAGATGQSPNYIADGSNALRPANMRVPENTGNVYGTYAEFFGSQVPKVVPPEYTLMGQPDGSTTAIGSPFYAYRTPAFGKRRRARRTRRY
jgi:hypothetical protein